MLSPVEYIKNEDIRNIIIDTINDFGARDNYAMLGNAEQVAFWSYKLLESRNMVSEGTQQTFVDLVIAAAMIHNLFINESVEDYKYMVFEARRILTPYFKEKGMPNDYAGYIFSMIEGQYGESSPVASVKPNPDTPQSIIATAKFFIDNLENYNQWFTDRFLTTVNPEENTESEESAEEVVEEKEEATEVAEEVSSEE